MGSVATPGSPWDEITTQIAKKAVVNAGKAAGTALSKKAVVNAGIVAGTALGGPITGAIVGEALSAILQGQAAQLRQLELIKADTRALVEGPYNTGMSWLSSAAEKHRSGDDRREFIEYARNYFMEASGQEQDLLRGALINYQLGNCWILLGSNEDARVCFEKAQAAAIRYANKKWEWVSRAEKLPMPWDSDDAAFAPFGAAVSGAIIGSVVPVLGTVTGALVGGALGASGVTAPRVAKQYSLMRARRRFAKEAAPAVDLALAVEKLDKEAPQLRLHLAPLGRLPRKLTEQRAARSGLRALFEE